MHPYVHKRLSRGYTNLEKIVSDYSVRLFRDNPVSLEDSNSTRELFLTYARHLLENVLERNSEIRRMPFKESEAPNIFRPVRALLRGVTNHLTEEEIESDMTYKTENDLVKAIPHKKVIQVCSLVRKLILNSRAN
ncbi:MAG: hypothetical protein OEY44_03465 [Candidatus Peregrinibacteria bacterium]|nr:hypothetical protein [Candidatus Peregrinibacteria bacterium]